MSDSTPVRILVVDDLPDKHVVYRAVLDEPGQQIGSAYSGEDALKHVLEDDYAVILLDVNMPGMDGFETAAMLRTRKRSSHTPIIFITAFADELFAVKGYSYGAVDYILMPVAPNILRTKVGVFVQLFRLSEQVKAQAAHEVAQAESEQARLAAILENAADFVGRADAEGRLKRLNRAGRRILGLSESDALIDPRIPDHGLAIARLDGVWFGESSLYDRNGRAIPVSQIILAHKNEDKTVESFSVIARDITEKKRAERAIHDLAAERAHLLESERCARAEAERLGRLKDEFLATLSHELRTPLNAVLGWAKLLQGPRATAEDVTEGLQVIVRNAQVQTQLVADLLDMNRIISGKLQLNTEATDLVKLVNDAVDTVRPTALAKRISLTLSAPDEHIWVLADSNRLQQVVWNLLTNAIKFTPQGGEVDVRVTAAHEDVEIQVQDSGEGIAPEFMPYLFDRFRQADATAARRHGGLGLGLAIAKQLVELHGGAIEAHSEGCGKGAKFLVELPRPASLPMESETGLHTTLFPAMEDMELSSEVPQLCGLRILVVDDEPDAVHLAKRVLEDRQAEVLVAFSAADAYECLNREQPDLLISDIGMPVEDGYSLIRRIRRSENGSGRMTPAIAMTAFARPEDRERALAAGYQAHVTKPVDPGELVRVVAAISDEATAARQ